MKDRGSMQPEKANLFKYLDENYRYDWHVYEDYRNLIKGTEVKTSFENTDFRDYMASFASALVVGDNDYARLLVILGQIPRNKTVIVLEDRCFGRSPVSADEYEKTIRPLAESSGFKAFFLGSDPDIERVERRERSRQTLRCNKPLNAKLSRAYAKKMVDYQCCRLWQATSLDFVGDGYEYRPDLKRLRDVAKVACRGLVDFESVTASKLRPISFEDACFMASRIEVELAEDDMADAFWDVESKMGTIADVWLAQKRASDRWDRPTFGSCDARLMVGFGEMEEMADEYIERHGLASAFEAALEGVPVEDIFA